jgi:hypothetical protein
MKKVNECYLVRLVRSERQELYFKKEGGWWKVSTRGRWFRATPEQVLNHLLPALAGLSRGLEVRVEHYEDPSDRPLPGP